MKRKMLVALVAVSLVALLAFGALASSIYFTGNCNVRSGPGLGYGGIGSVNAGSYLTYLGSSRVDNRGVTWYKVSFGNSVGWVSSVYGRITSGSGYATYGGGGGSPSRSGSSWYDSDDYDDYEDYDDYDDSGSRYSGDYVRGVSGDSFVRTGPGLGYGKLGVLYNGQRATYLDETRYDNRGVAWYLIRWYGDEGWVSSRYTEIY